MAETSMIKQKLEAWINYAFQEELHTYICTLYIMLINKNYIIKIINHKLK